MALNNNYSYFIDNLKEPLKEIDWLLKLDNGSEEQLNYQDIFTVKVQGLNSSGWIAFYVNNDGLTDYQLARRLFYSLGLSEDIEPTAFAKIYAECFYIISLKRFIADGFIKYQRGEE